MKRSNLSPLPPYFDRYINKCDDVELIVALQSSIDEVDQLPLEQLQELGDTVYAPGKWTVKDILQHIIDTERVFCFRALSFARDEQQPMLTMDENHYATVANAGNRTWEALIEELKISHHSFKVLYQSFTDEMLLKRGQSFNGTYSVADIGFIMPGHQRWHFDIIKEKYLPLL